MGFKIKKWGALRTVKVNEYGLGTFKSYQTPGGAGITTRGFAVPWQGKIVVMCYAEDDTPVYLVYDPATDSFTGPTTVSLGAWSTYSAFYGWQREFRYWGNEYLIGQAMPYGFYVSTPDIYFTRGFTFGKFGEPPGLFYGTQLGILGGLPTRLRFESSPGVTIVHASTPEGHTPLDSGDIRFGSSWGSTVFKCAPWNGLFTWTEGGPSDWTTKLYARPRRDGDSPVFDGYYTSSFIYGISHPTPRGLTYLYANSGGESGHAWAGSTEFIDNPYASEWHYQLERDGYPQLDEWDVDGRAHGVALPVSGLSFLNSSLGWMVTVGKNEYNSPLQFTVYVLDPTQPAGRSTSVHIKSAQLAGWVGEYGIRDDLVLEHVLPFPDERDPSGGGVMPPQERSDGYVLGSKEVFRRQGNQLAYLRDAKMDLTSYSTSGPDWWFPGMSPDGTYPGFWHLFAGRGPTVIGRMPDYMWGMRNPLGAAIDRGLGLPAENLQATEPQATHVVKNADVISNTLTWATPMTGTLSNQRAMLVCSLSDDRFCYFENANRVGQMPYFKALAGEIKAKSWTTLVDFTSKGPPGLGESNWTVWSVVPIPKCRALPQGGYLVGATLYFDPWLEGEWGWTAGAREHTFRDTGKGYLPALPDYVGPVAQDHGVRLLSAYDEWTANRSLYGPDALLVYDHAGAFVECLNSENLHAPNGREIMVVPGAMPRILYRLYRFGTYSDYAEAYGQYHRLDGNEEIQVPLYVCYDLENSAGEIAPGAGLFRGFVDMHAVGAYSPQVMGEETHWRWSQVAPTLYEWQYPKTQWSPPGASYVRAGLGGRQPVLLIPGPPSAREGVRGMGQRG